VCSSDLSPDGSLIAANIGDVQSEKSYVYIVASNGGHPGEF
jgi:hypothetical protein